MPNIVFFFVLGSKLSRGCVSYFMEVTVALDSVCIRMYSAHIKFVSTDVPGL